MRSTIFATTFLALALSACGSGPDSDPTTPASESTSAANAPSPAETAARDRENLEKWILAQFPGMGSIGYQSSEFDLDGDGTPEVLAYVGGPSMCGSGGCQLLVLRRTGTTLTEIARTTVTQLPVGVLDTSSNGWRDLWVTTAGGGELTGRRKLKHDGTGYPTNPTVPPAEELDILDVQILIDQGDLIALD